MRFNKKFLLAGVALAGSIFAGAMFATQSKAATDALDIDAVIVAAITVNCTVALDFGDIAASSAGGSNTVTVDVADTRSIAGAGNGTLVGGTGATSGVCGVTGESGRLVEVSVADTTVTGPGPAMAVNNWDLDTIGTDGASPQSFTLTAGPDNVIIGADLVVAQGQTAGTYAGTATVTVDYQ